MMKLTPLFTALICLNTGFSQNVFLSNCEKIKQIDAYIQSRDNRETNTESTTQDRRSLNKKEIYSTIEKELAPLMNVGLRRFDADDFTSMLDCIENIETLTWLEYFVSESIDNYRLDSVKSETQLISWQEAILEAIHERLNKRMKSDFTYYGFANSTEDWVKGIYVEHGNDFLSIPAYNDDRDLTGSIRLEIFTDQLKMRLFSGYSDRLINLNGRNWYTYQSVFMGGEGYTPFLRDTSLFNTPTSYDPDDRPYASFVYVGRGKHRIHRLGRYRSFAQLKIGKIGSLDAGIIQSLIHRDIAVSSQTPQGWEAQIAAGGRLAVSYELLGEWRIVPRDDGWAKGLTALFLGSIGHDKTYAGLGIGVSNRDLKKRGGINLNMNTMSKPHGFIETMKKSITVSATANYRYIFHNSMLEGYGVFKHMLDEDPKTPIDIHILTNSQMQRHVFTSEFNVNLRLKYVGIIFKQSIMSPEFDLPVNTKEYAYGGASGTGVGNHNRNKWNHFGTLGLLFTFK